MFVMLVQKSEWLCVNVPNIIQNITSTVSKCQFPYISCNKKKIQKNIIHFDMALFIVFHCHCISCKQNRLAIYTCCVANKHCVTCVCFFKQKPAQKIVQFFFICTWIPKWSEMSAINYQDGEMEKMQDNDVIMKMNTHQTKMLEHFNWIGFLWQWKTRCSNADYLRNEVFLWLGLHYGPWRFISSLMNAARHQSKEMEKKDQKLRRY